MGDGDAFDCVVVGVGMIGSAALKYLSAKLNNVAGIGPSSEEVGDIEVHSSHNDEGRIYRELDGDPIWSYLSRRSISSFKALEEAENVCLLTRTGAVYVSPRDDAIGLGRKGVEIAKTMKIDVLQLDEHSIKQHVEYLNLPQKSAVIYERGEAGIMNPRKVVVAQLNAAKKKGAILINDIVKKVEDVLRNGREEFILHCQSGHLYKARKVIIATGAYANSFDILPKKLAVSVKSEITLLARIEASHVWRYKQMPVILYKVQSTDLNGIYMLPPILYPDGQHYLKLGCNTCFDSALDQHDSLVHWFKEGESDLALVIMTKALQDIIPDLEADSYETRRCVITRTEHGKPYIDQVSRGCYVAVGGNGKSAKSSDALGELASELVLGETWPERISRADFRACYL